MGGLKDKTMLVKKLFQHLTVEFPHYSNTIDESQVDIVLHLKTLLSRTNTRAGYNLGEHPLHNNGQVEGTTSIRVEVIENGDDRRLIDIVNIEVPATLFLRQMDSRKSGTAGIEITTPNGMNDRTAPGQVEKGESTFVIESLDDK